MIEQMNEWVEKAKANDKEAIQSLYNETKNHAYFIALQCMHKESDALDVLQDSYIKAFRCLDQLDEGANFGKWFHRIVVNTSKDYLKKKKPTLFTEIEEDGNVEFVEERIEFQPEASLDYSETKRLVMGIINTLSQEQRLCVLLYYFEEYSIKEIAQCFDCSEGTIKSRLNYARKNIKEGVLQLEEKEGIKLHSISILPFFAWMLCEEEIFSTLPYAAANTVFKKVVKEKLVSTRSHMRIHNHLVTSRFIAISTILSSGIIAGSCMAWYEMTKFVFEVQTKSAIQLEYGSELAYHDVIASINEEVVDEISSPFLYDEKEITFTLQYDASLIGEQEATLLTSYDDEVLTTPFTITIQDSLPPILTLKEESIELDVDTTFEAKDYIYEAYDSVDGTLVDSVEIDNPVDMSEVGEYSVVYSLADFNGLQTSQSLQVHVLEKIVSAAPVGKQRPADNKEVATATTYAASLQPRVTGFSALDARVASILGSIIHNGMSNEQKIRAIHDWIANNTTYGYSYASLAQLGSFSPSDEHMVLQQGIAQDAGAVLFNGTGVCDDYAAAFEVLAQRIGFDVIREGGRAPGANNQLNGHMWNRILLNGTWYYIDVQGDDYGDRLYHSFYLLPTYPSGVQGDFVSAQQIDRLTTLAQASQVSGIQILSKDKVTDYVAQQYNNGAKDASIAIIDNNLSISFSDAFDWKVFCDDIDRLTNTTDHMAVDYWEESSGNGKILGPLGFEQVTFVFEH